MAVQVGRPSKFKPAYSNILIEHLAEGASITSFAAEIGVARSTINQWAEDILVNRRHFVLHPSWVKWKSTPAGVGPTNAELGVGTNWERVYEQNNVRIVQFRHRNAAA